MAHLRFDLIPHIGAAPILLGAPREAVRRAMAQLGLEFCNANSDLDYFCENSVQVEFADDGNAWFIGFSQHERYNVFFNGLDVFDHEASVVFEWMGMADGSGTHVWDPDEYRFPNQILTLWGTDEQYDGKGGYARPVWAQVGVGDRRYLEAVAS